MIVVFILIAVIAAFATGYCIGKADGIGWTVELFDEYFEKYSFDAVLKEVLNHIKTKKWVKASDQMPSKSGIYTVIRKYCNAEEKAEYFKEMNTFTNYEGYAVEFWLYEPSKPDTK